MELGQEGFGLKKCEENVVKKHHSRVGWNPNFGELEDRRGFGCQLVFGSIFIFAGVLLMISISAASIVLAL